MFLWEQLILEIRQNFLHKYLDLNLLLSTYIEFCLYLGLQLLVLNPRDYLYTLLCYLQYISHWSFSPLLLLYNHLVVMNSSIMILSLAQIAT